MSNTTHASRQEAAETVVRFFRQLDDRDYDGLCALLHPQGEWHRQGKVLHGPAETLAALQQRSATMRIHHLLTNILTHNGDDGEVAVSAYMSVIRNEPRTHTTDALPFDGIENIRTVRARLRATGDGWHIVHMGSDPVSFSNHAG